MLSPNKKESYTYEDYCEWDDGNRYEVINGIAYMLAAPLRNHQTISGELYKQLAVFLTGKSCKVYSAPFDVILSDDTVVQPDISVICDRSKLTKAGCSGAPDLIIEILSPSSVVLDTIVKLNKYMSGGVKEYWIVDIEHKTILVYTFDKGVNDIQSYSIEEDIPVQIFNGCVLSLKNVIEELD
jgi:Uma2 family endonuclease